MASFSAAGDYGAARRGAGFVHALLRRGNRRSAEGAVRFARAALRQSRPRAQPLDVRIDAGWVNGRVLDALDDEGARFVGRIRNNAGLDALAQPYRSRALGRPTKAGAEFAVELGDYQAARWTRPYRVGLVVRDRPDRKPGLRDLFPHAFFLLTNGRPEQKGSWALWEHYRPRGPFEDRLGAFNGAIGNGLSAGSFAAHAASLLLKLLAFNLAGMRRGALEDASGCGGDLRRVPQTGLKAGARVVEQGRRVLVDVARAAGVLWERRRARIERWGLPRRLPTGPRGAVCVWGRSRPRRWMPPPRQAHLCLVLRE